MDSTVYLKEGNLSFSTVGIWFYILSCTLFLIIRIRCYKFMKTSMVCISVKNDVHFTKQIDKAYVS